MTESCVGCLSQGWRCNAMVSEPILFGKSSERRSRALEIPKEAGRHGHLIWTTGSGGTY
ncbi:hypothetical protein CENSYa_0535 [Cenarchaeum symbiosum A]|uniref:Uncharacterized protein n=1 Tax=Cenarchaeum symbiosum (strain A) TaxID=414004 RepID=A0RV01_CENSY|nr:hypothetical protein CENSYa_0535 [Cenarchaeum symbiosum A]